MYASRHQAPHLTSLGRAGIFIAFLLVGAHPVPAAAQILRDEFWVPDGQVRDLVITGNTVYLGGDFTQVGPPIGAFAGLDPTTGTVQQPFARVSGIVRSVVSDGAGGWYIGGTFDAVRGVPRANLARLDASGNLTGWNPGANSDVFTLVRDATTGVVYVGGQFSNLGGLARQGIAAVDSNGVVTAWNAAIATGAVTALALSGGTLYAGGTFTSVAGQTRRRAAALDATTGAVGAWNPDADDLVSALAVHVTIGFPSTVTVYLGGLFHTVGGQVRDKLAAVDGVTGALAPWNPGANSFVNAIALAGGSNPITNPLRIYVGGTFQVVAGTARNGIAQLTEGGAVASWNPNASGAVNALRIVGNLMYVGGEFTSIGGLPTRYLAAVDRTTGLATNWDPRLSGFVRALATTSTSVVAGGDFFTAGGVPRQNLAALDLATGQPTTWNPGADAPVEALETDGAMLYAAGSFTQMGGQPRTRLAAVDLTAGAATAWNPEADATVSELALGGGVLYAAGAFTTIGGQPRARLAAIDLGSGLPTPWNPGTTGSVSSIKVDGSWVYVGGTFLSLGGGTRIAIGRLDRTTGALSAWNPNSGGSFSSRVFALEVIGANVYVGGFFSQMGGRPRECLAVVDAVSAAANPWDPFTDGGNVLTLAAEGASVYVGGAFQALGGTRRLGIAALDAATGLVLPWNAAGAGGTRALKVRQGMICAAASSRYPGTHGSFAVFTAATTDVAGGLARAPAAGISASPNPFHSALALRFALLHRSEVDVTIHDLAGRTVRRLAHEMRDAGTLEIMWDGRDEAGGLVGPGIYFASATTGAASMTAKVLRVR